MNNNSASSSSFIRSTAMRSKSVFASVIVCYRAKVPIAAPSHPIHDLIYLSQSRRCLYARRTLRTQFNAGIKLTKINDFLLSLSLCVCCVLCVVWFGDASQPSFTRFRDQMLVNRSQNILNDDDLPSPYPPSAYFSSLHRRQKTVFVIWSFQSTRAMAHIDCTHICRQRYTLILPNRQRPTFVFSPVLWCRCCCCCA